MYNANRNKNHNSAPILWKLLVDIFSFGITEVKTLIFQGKEILGSLFLYE